MHVFAVLSSLLLVPGISPVFAKKGKGPGQDTPSSPSAASGCMPTTGDTGVVGFAYALESLGHDYYTSVPLNSTAFSQAPNDSTALWFPNFRGMEKRGNVSLMALEGLGRMTPNFRAPRCNFSLPTPSSPRDLLDTTYDLEQSLCGAYIGLAGHSQSPEVAFLMARLAAGHAGNAVYIRSHLMEPVFSERNNSLYPAYPPERVLSNGSAPGMLGDYLGDCVMVPVKPCGKTLVVNGTSGNLTDNKSIISYAMATQTAAP